MQSYDVAVLFESDEWSDHKLARELQQELAGQASVGMVDMRQPGCVEQALGCRLLVSRVFASAQFRGNGAAHQHMEELVRRLQQPQFSHITIVNEPRAHAFEVSKALATRTLGEAGIPVPQVYACGLPTQLEPSSFHYPCVIKPDCGGRTTHTLIAHSLEEARAFIGHAPAIEFIVESFERPAHGFITRIEVVDGRAAFIYKRSVAESGLSSYHEGSTYQRYLDCDPRIVADAERAAATLGFSFGSFDAIETGELGIARFIDANSVSNVSEDCDELLGIDLMHEYAVAMARSYGEIVRRG